MADNANKDELNQTRPITIRGDREKLLERLKRETSRLSLDDTQAKPPSRSVPKTIQLKRPQTTKARVLKPGTKKSPPVGSARVIKGDTTQLREAPTVARAADESGTSTPTETRQADSISKAISEDMKKVTSRILLDDVLPAETDVDPKNMTMPVMPARPATRKASAAPKTIKLKRPAQSSTTRRVQTSQAKADTKAIGEAATIIKKKPAAKKETAPLTVNAATTKPPTQRHKTSKISDTRPIEDGKTPPPKTIRLKRESSTPQMDTMQAEVDTQKKGETARIDLPDKPPDITPVTQRKTIQIKRSGRNAPTAGPGAGAPSGATAPAGAPSQLFQRKQPPQSAEKSESQIGIAFSIAAVLAVLFAVCAVYVLAAQAFAPDVSLPVPALY